MLNVKTLEETERIISEIFNDIRTDKEYIHLSDAFDRTIAEDIISDEDVPGFNRSTVDGYAVISSDVFGCSESIPALLNNIGKVSMGQPPDFALSQGQCAYVPTGGQIPDNADAMVMLEYTEKYYDNLIGIIKASSPGQNIIFLGDDVKKKELFLKKDHLIRSKEIGALAALGIDYVAVNKRPVVGVISTGDELVRFDEKVISGKIRDVNSEMICSLVNSSKSEAINYGIVKDQYCELKEIIMDAAEKCDVVIITGGTSVGEKDESCKILSERGEVFIHGIAIKPGKPTIVGKINNKPVFCLPGHPVAAYFIYYLIVAKMLYKMQGLDFDFISRYAVLNSNLPSNNGREECVAVKIIDSAENINEDAQDRKKLNFGDIRFDNRERINLICMPIIGKSGLITKLINADGFIRVARNCEGYSKGEIVVVNLFP